MGLYAEEAEGVPRDERKRGLSKVERNEDSNKFRSKWPLIHH